MGTLCDGILSHENLLGCRTEGNRHVSGRTLKSWTANVSGNRLSLATGRPNCQRANDTYFLVQDPISKRVGRSQNVSANCVRID